MEMRPERLLGDQQTLDGCLVLSSGIGSLDVAASFSSFDFCWVSAQHVLLFDSAREDINSDGEGVSESGAGSI